MSFPQPLPSIPLVDSDLRLSLAWRQYMPRLDSILRGLVGTNNFTSPVPLTQVSSPSNANAAAAGVAVGQLYTSTANPAPVYVRTA